MVNSARSGTTVRLGREAEVPGAQPNDRSGSKRQSTIYRKLRELPNEKGALGRLLGYEYIISGSSKSYEYILQVTNIFSPNKSADYQPDSFSAVALILWMERSAPMNSSS